MLHVTAPVPSGWGTARVSTGCATPCRSRARHWQLAAGPGAGSGKARHKTDHKQAQICLLCRMPNQIAHDHLSTAGRVACVKVGWAPTLAAGRRPRRGESAKRVTKQTTNRRKSVSCAVCPTRCTRSPLSTAGRVACVKVGWAPTLAAGRRPRRGELAKRVTKQTTNRRKSVSCAVCPYQLHTITLFTAARVACVKAGWAPTGDPACAWQLAGGPGPQL